MEHEFLDGRPQVVSEAEALTMSKEELAKRMAALSILAARNWGRIYYDDLSRLPNHRAMNEVIAKLEELFLDPGDGEESEQGGEEWIWFGHKVDRVGVVYIDLDRFKEINDKFGHREGDTAIFNVAMFLNQAVNGDGRRQGDMVFRAHTAGDEFIVLLPYKTPESDGVEDILETIEAPFERVIQPFLEILEDLHELYKDEISREEWMAIIGASVGKAVYNPFEAGDGPRNIDATIELAEQRMRSEKERHRRAR